MPTAPIPFCPTPGCTERSRGPCKRHRSQQRQRVDLHRGSAHTRGYTARWGRYSRQRLARYPWCTDPYGLHGRFRVLAVLTDHIKPARLYPELFWDPTNHQSLCDGCHDRKSADEQFGRESH